MRVETVLYVLYKSKQKWRPAVDEIRQQTVLKVNKRAAAEPQANCTTYLHVHVEIRQITPHAIRYDTVQPKTLDVHAAVEPLEIAAAPF